MVKTINSATFKEEIKGKCIVDFYTSWCPTCEQLSPVFEQASEDMDSVKFFGVNLDDSMELAEKYKIMYVPTVILFDGETVVNQNVGFMDKEKLIQFAKNAEQ